MLNSFIDEITTLLLKWWVWLAWITVAVVAKFSHNLSMGKKITFWGGMGSVGLAFSLGLMVANIMIYIGWNDVRGTTVTIFFSIISDRFFTWLIANWKQIIRYALNYKPAEDDKDNNLLP